ncbi:MAG: LVIVD repeat-containing protein [Actinomycetota bacterium]
MARSRTRVSSAVAAVAVVAAAVAGAAQAHGCHVPDARVASAAARACGFQKVGSIEVSEAAGLGRVELHGKLAAVLQRDEGVVSLVDVSKPAAPHVLGRYDGGIEQQRAGKSLDGDLAFSSDGRWLLYARQSTQLSADGLHVIDVSDPAAPALRNFQQQCGSYRVALHETESATYAITLDAIEGLVVNRFDTATGALVPVFSDPLPALRRVGGPASAGLFVDPKDPRLGVPLLYATSGTTGLQVYDLSAPESPELLGSWGEEGLAEVEVVRTGKTRTVYVATEYWFDSNTKPEVIVLDARDLDAIEEKRRIGLGLPATDEFRIQGMSLAQGPLLVAHSQAGLIAYTLDGHDAGYFTDLGARNEAAGASGEPYAFDVEASKGLLYVTDGATGTLTIVRATRH